MRTLPTVADRMTNGKNMREFRESSKMLGNVAFSDEFRYSVSLGSSKMLGKALVEFRALAFILIESRSLTDVE